MKHSKNSLREKCLNTEFFLVRIFPYLDWIRKNTDQENLHIRTLFAQRLCYTFYQKWIYYKITRNIKENIFLEFLLVTGTRYCFLVSGNQKSFRNCNLLTYFRKNLEVRKLSEKYFNTVWYSRLVILQKIVFSSFLPWIYPVTLRQEPLNKKTRMFK